MKLFDVHALFLIGIGCLAATGITRAETSLGNRLAYLDEPNNPWQMERGSAKLITPQWIGEEGVEAVIVLAIDDMSGDGQHFRNYLTPIINRLKEIDGRGPVSITCNQPEPEHPNMQWFLQQGISLETHTLTHPCPLLQRHRFRRASFDYHGCVDLLAQTPNNRSVGFRFGCMDGQNTPSPRAYAEILNGVAVTTDPFYQTEGNFYLNTQIWEDLVTNPEGESVPEEILLDRLNGWDFTVVRPSNRAPDGQQILTKPTLRDLQIVLSRIDATFRARYKVLPWTKSFAIEVEFKITKEGAVSIKQAQPWVF